MRTLILALGVAALATGPALAQVGVSRGSAPVTSTTGTSTGTSTRTTTLDSSVAIAAPQPAAGGASSNVAGGGATTGFGTNTTTNVHADTPGSSFAPGGPFSNDSGNTALGTSAGQTSAGTLVGNSGTGIGANSAGLATGLDGVVGVPELVPDGNVSVIGGGTTGARLAVTPSTLAQSTTVQRPTNTPLFDMAARQGRERIASRRAAGDEPRIYGIAPNTERDLTWQMPDDPIIRY